MASSNTLDNFRKQLGEDLINYGKNICKLLAQDITDNLVQESRLSIKDFYLYSPKKYFIHGNFNYSFRRDYKNRYPRFYGGVELLIDSLPDVYTGTNSDPKSVFWRVYSGYHGIASFQGYAPIMRPAPINRILNKREELIKQQDRYIGNAEKKARNLRYNIMFQ